MEIDLTDSPSATSVSTPTDGGLHLHKRRRTDDPASDRDDLSSRTDPEGDDSHIHHPPLNGGSASNNNSGTESTRTTVVLSEPPQWQRVIEKAVKAIVSIRFSQVSAFDTEGNNNSSFSFYAIYGSCVIILAGKWV